MGFMASIPLPALSIRPPETPSPMQTLGQIMQMRAMQQETQLRNQQIANAGLENQERALDLQSRQGMLKAYQEADGDLTKALPLAGKYGVSPKDVISLQQAAFQQRQNAMTELKTKGELALQQADLMQGAHDTVAAAKPEDRPAVYQQQLARLQQAGIDLSQAPPQYPGDDQFKLMGIGLRGHTQLLQDLSKQTEIGKNQAQAGEANARAEEAAANTEKTKQEMQYGTGPMADSRYRFIQQQKALGKPVSADDAAFLKAYEKQKTLVPAFNFSVQNGATAQQLDSTARAIASGDMKWENFVSNKTPMAVKTALLQQIKEINPQYNSGDFEVEKKVRELFTSGDVSKQLMAINTAREHMKTFSQLADALNNGDVQAANKIGNAFGVQFGSDKATNFKIASQAFGGEVGKAFDGAGVTQSERESASKSFNENMSPQQFRGAVKTVDDLLAGKQRAAQQSYQAGTSGKPNFGGQSQAGGAAQHVIQIGDKQYRYNGSGATDDLKNYTEIKKP